MARRGSSIPGELGAKERIEEGMVLNVEKAGVCTIAQYMNDNRHNWAGKARCPVRMRLLVEKDGATVAKDAHNFAVSPKLSDAHELKIIG